jgi:hypothetical protein
MSQNCRSAEQAARDYPGGHPMDLLAIRRSPNFGPEEPQTSLNQPVVQVRENHVVATRRGVGVECDRALLLGVGVQKPGQARLPGGIRKSRDMESMETIFQNHRNQLRLPGQIESDINHGFDIRRGHVQHTARLVKLIRVFAGKLPNVLLEAQKPLHRLVFPFRPRGVEALPLSKHCLFDLLRDHRSDLAEVFPDLLNLLCCAVQELKVCPE